jgi:YVTN family beta-propeller protein
VRSVFHSNIALRTGLCIVALTVAPVTTRAGEALITNQPGDSLSFVALDTMKEVAKLKIGGKPAGITLSPNKSKVYITTPDSKEVVEVDVPSRTVERRIVLGGVPLGIAANPSRPEIYVADWYAHKIIVINTASLSVVSEIPVGQSPSGVAVTPGGQLLLSADRDSNSVSIIDVATRGRLASVSVGEGPFGITIDAMGLRAYTADVKSNDVAVVDIAARRTLGRIPTGRRPYAVALAAGKGFATDQYGGTVTVFDLASLMPIKAIEACDHPEGIETDASGADVYVACWGDNALIRIDPVTLVVTGKAAVGEGPRAFGKFLR